jgi:O-antigen ligase
MTLKISKWLFLLLIVSLPLVRPFNTIIFGLQVPATDFIFLAVFAFWFIALLRGETHLKFDWLYIFIGFYALTLVISAIFSIQPKQSLYKLLGEFYLFALAVLTLNFVQDKRFYKPVVIAWLIGTGFTVLASAAGFGLFYIGYKTQADNYFLSHFGSLPASNYPRIHALFANANMMCNFLNISLMLAILAGELNWLKKIYAQILQIGIWFAAVFTFSSGLGGMFLSSGVWFWSLWLIRQKLRLSKLALILAVLSALAVFGATLISPDTNNTSQEFNVPLIDKKVEVSVRVLVWESALQTFRQFPLTGKGTGSDAAFVSYETLSGDRQILLDAHNVFLNVLGQEGLLGLISFLALNIYLLTRCRFKAESLNEHNLIHSAFSAIFLGAFLDQGLTGSFEDARHLWILFGLLVGISKTVISESDISPASRAP